MRWVTRAVVTCVPWSVLLCAGCGPGDPLPPPDECTAGGAVAATELEIGRGGDGPFVALQNLEMAPITYGSQGGIMLVYRLRVRGAGEATCLPQRTTVTTVGGGTPGALDIPLQLYPDGEGNLVTRPTYIVLAVLPQPIELIVRTEAASLVAERRLFAFGGSRQFTLDVPPIVSMGTCAEATVTTTTAEVTLASSDPAILRVPPSVTADAAGVAQFEVCGDAAGVADVVATAAGTEMRAAVRVQRLDVLAGFVTLAPGGTGLMGFTLLGEGAVPTGGLRIALAVEPPDLAHAPSEVVLAAGRSDVTVRLRAGDRAGAGHLVYRIGDQEPGRAPITVVESAPPAVRGDLLIEEVLYDATADANCDGTVDGGDQFVEVRNRMTGPRAMGGVRVVGSGGEVFAAFAPDDVLGAGEVMVFFAGEPGSVPSGPWCDGFGGGAISGTPYRRSGGAPFDPVQEQPILSGPDGHLWHADLPYPESPGESVYGTSGIAHHELGARDRPFSPGTHEDGRPFVDADVE